MSQRIIKPYDQIHEPFADRIPLDLALVCKAIHTQFPELNNCGVTPLLPGGWDNYTFRVGNSLIARIPSARRYVSKVDKEQNWLPLLAKELTLEIPRIYKAGKTCDAVPWPFTLFHWIDGEIYQDDFNEEKLCSELTSFLKELQEISVLDGPKPGAHNFFRGAEPSIYGEEVQECIRDLELKLPDIALQDLWGRLTSIPCEKSPMWLHGDLNPANLLHRNGSLCAVLDFGGMAVGDPACDYSLAWTSFSRGTREKFFRELSLDEGDVLRSAAWAFWKLLLNLRNNPENQKLISVLETIEKETGDCL